MNNNEQAQMQGWENYLNNQNPQEQEYDVPLCECGLPLYERYDEQDGEDMCEECAEAYMLKNPLQIVKDNMDLLLEACLVRRG